MFYFCGRRRLVCWIAVVSLLLSFYPLPIFGYRPALMQEAYSHLANSSVLTRKSDNSTETFIIAAADNNSSIKSDAIWATTTKINIDSHNWSTIANFSTGRYLAAVNDYGVTWTSNNNAGAHNWYVNYYMI